MHDPSWAEMRPGVLTGVKGVSIRGGQACGLPRPVIDKSLTCRILCRFACSLVLESSYSDTGETPDLRSGEHAEWAEHRS